MQIVPNASTAKNTIGRRVSRPQSTPLNSDFKHYFPDDHQLYGYSCSYDGDVVRECTVAPPHQSNRSSRDILPAFSPVLSTEPQTDHPHRSQYSVLDPPSPFSMPLSLSPSLSLSLSLSLSISISLSLSTYLSLALSLYLPPPLSPPLRPFRRRNTDVSLRYRGVSQWSQVLLAETDIDEDVLCSTGDIFVM